MSLFSNFKNNLQKTSNFLSSNILSSLQNKKVDNETLEELESILISADISLDVVEKLINSVRKVKSTNQNIATAVLEILATEIEIILQPREQKILEENEKNPKILIFVGVNGSGKTTTIGKLINKISNDKKILIAACDTFRAAAVEQLKEWAKINNSDFFQGNLEQDPASVAFSACKKAKDENYDYVIIDTAGRLSNNTNLLNQLIKVKTVINKLIESTNIKTILVLDGTNGSNMIKQVEIFNKSMNVDGLIITKIDGTAKGGALISIAKNYDIPIYFVGLGEKVEDLVQFNARDFSNSIIGTKD